MRVLAIFVGSGSPRGDCRCNCEMLMLQAIHSQGKRACRDIGTDTVVFPEFFHSRGFSSRSLFVRCDITVESSENSRCGVPLMKIVRN